MKNFHCKILFALVLALCSCRRSNIFEATANDPIHNPVFGPSGEMTIAFEIIGNQTDFYRALQVESNGFVRYLDSLQTAGQTTSALTQEEYGNLVALFLEKDFLHLQDHYLGEFTSSAFRYRVLFNYGGTEKLVLTDSLSAPAGLQKILARLSQQMLAVRQQALQLDLAVNRDTLAHGQEAELALTVTNPHAYAIQLRSGELLVEFFVVACNELTQAGRREAYALPYLWRKGQSEASGKFIHTSTLAAGESLTYGASWNGRNNAGAFLHGTFWIAARFATVPGGYSAWHPIQVVNR